MKCIGSMINRISKRHPYLEHDARTMHRDVNISKNFLGPPEGSQKTYEWRTVIPEDRTTPLPFLINQRLNPDEYLNFYEGA